MHNGDFSLEDQWRRLLIASKSQQPEYYLIAAMRCLQNAELYQTYSARRSVGGGWSPARPQRLSEFGALFPDDEEGRTGGVAGWRVGRYRDRVAG